VDAGGVDRLDRRFRVRVGRQQHALCVWIKLHHAHQQLHAGHARHALVGKVERDHIAALLELLADIQRGLAGGGAENAVVLPVGAPQILNHRFQNAGVIVDCE
jgi:hypothetical protein